MEIVETEGFCTCCGKLLKFKKGQENFCQTLNLNNYNNYKHIYLHLCKNCGFVSTDISGEEGVLYGNIKQTGAFLNLLNYTYLKGLDEQLAPGESVDNPAGLYEAYSLICLADKNYEKYVRVINQCIYYKTTLKNKFRLLQEEYAEDEGNEEQFTKLLDLIEKSITNNRQQLVKSYDLIKNKNVFLKLILIENLMALQQFELAKQHLSDIKNLSPDLAEYINNKAKI